ncbi:DUF6484 domain-containing protein [Mesorhizobium sp. M00.F.Ca.ET.216.01.1.1]|uniref:DUF6484 domain-containing protein n=1 Tax=Mesorhizobium sp. M00.F.Ca.ET.216.01.1.1 TaxID=2500528 RepID=UPI000FDC34F9|nr:DUF6484 domain-containing protein [Mesorhizobium sp. M00.F.Ca.ET.216.01.1.1]TGQ38410.1 hypothetical protein EN859_018230 [Mesorhizobium sp. M00.F.Ca.ET.216.01.1.1]
MAKTIQRVDGVVIGVFLGFDDAGPLVVFPGNPRDTALSAHTLADLTPEMIGSEVALLFQEGDVTKPLIVGRIVKPPRKSKAPQETKKSDTVTIFGDDRIELRCGKAVIIMEKDGRITIRGTYLTSHASATNRIRGGSVNLN